MIYLGADHRGFRLKEEIKKHLRNLGQAFEDLGNKKFDPKDDYPDFAKRVAKAVSRSPKNKGILVCGSGLGMSIAANRFKKARAALCLNEKMAEMSRKHNNANILCLAADILPLAKAKKIIKIWLEAEFSKEKKHQRRIRKING